MKYNGRYICIDFIIHGINCRRGTYITIFHYGETIFSLTYSHITNLIKSAIRILINVTVFVLVYFLQLVSVSTEHRFPLTYRLRETFLTRTPRVWLVSRYIVSRVGRRVTYTLYAMRTKGHRIHAIARTRGPFDTTSQEHEKKKTVFTCVCILNSSYVCWYIPIYKWNYTRKYTPHKFRC
jgi:hypothetical protein